MQNNRRIFIVEDNELNLKLFNDILRSNGYDTAHTSNGFDATKKILDYQPDLVIMDIQLQGISGFDVIKELKQIDQCKDIPVIAVTAFAMKDDKNKILNSGFSSYIPKPISISSFLKIVASFEYSCESAVL